MKDSDSGDLPSGKELNAIALQNAVLCADCEVVSDSPHDRCTVCGSRSLVNLSRVLGGSLPQVRATLISAEAPKARRTEVVLKFRRGHTIRRRMPRQAA